MAKKGRKKKDIKPTAGQVAQMTFMYFFRLVFLHTVAKFVEQGFSNDDAVEHATAIVDAVKTDIEAANEKLQQGIKS